MLANSFRSESRCRDSRAAICYRETLQDRRMTAEFVDIVRGIFPKVPVFECWDHDPALPCNRVYGQRNSKEMVGDEKILAAFAAKLSENVDQFASRYQSEDEVGIRRKENYDETALGPKETNRTHYDARISEVRSAIFCR